MSRRIRQIGILAVVSLVALFALLPIAGAAPRAETKNVAVKDFEFAPKETTINVGDTVVWKNEGPARPHTATANDGTFDSGNLDVGAEFSFTFTKAGTISYVCRYHDQMQATIIVQEPGAPAAAPAAAPAQQATGSVEVSDQPVVNGEITVAKVTAGQDGWIVAHLDEGGQPGKVIGQTQIKAGDNNNVKIKLSEDVPDGRALWPMLHIDAGAAGTYEFPGADAPVLGADGKPVMKRITVTAAAAPAAQPTAAPAGSGTQQPGTLPNTGGEESGLGLALAALALLLVGAALTLGLRRRA